jgi:transposase
LFDEEVLNPLLQKMQPNTKNARKPLTLIHMDNARVHTAREPQDKLDVSRFRRTPQPPYSEDIAPFDFFFSVG